MWKGAKKGQGAVTEEISGLMGDAGAFSILNVEASSLNLKVVG